MHAAVRVLFLSDNHILNWAEHTEVNDLLFKPHALLHLTSSSESVLCSFSFIVNLFTTRWQLAFIFENENNVLAFCIQASTICMALNLGFSVWLLLFSVWINVCSVCMYSRIAWG